MKAIPVCLNRWHAEQHWPLRRAQLRALAARAPLACIRSTDGARHALRQPAPAATGSAAPHPAAWDDSTPTLRRIADALRAPAEFYEETYRRWRESLLPPTQAGLRTARLWTSEPGRRAEAAPCTHRMRCDACGRRSAAGVEFGSVRAWQLGHADRHPTHRAYTETLTRPWLASILGERGEEGREC
jgi:hypothetical protein